MKNLPKSLASLAAGLLVLLSPGASAANVQLETRVAGYSSAGWILVLPGLNGSLGGRVRFDRATNRWITDRIQRGEPLRLTVIPTTATERAQTEATVVLLPDSRGPAITQRIPLPFTGTMTVPADPIFREVVLEVWFTPLVWQRTNLPIGTRP